MDKDKIFSFYEKMYFESLNEKDVSLSRFPILIAGVTLIINAYIFLFNFDYFLWLSNDSIFTAIIAISVVMSRLFYCMFEAFKSKEYVVMPSLEKLAKHQEDMIQWSKEVSQFKKDHPAYEIEIPNVEEEMLKDIAQIFVECTTANAESSKERNFWFHKSMLWMWINLCMCIILPVSTLVISI